MMADQVRKCREHLGPEANRVAAMLMRHRLEVAVKIALAKHHAYGPLSGRAMMLGLRAIDEQVAKRAHYLWAVLSQAGHFHSSPSPPSCAQADRWLAELTKIVQGLEA